VPLVSFDVTIDSIDELIVNLATLPASAVPIEAFTLRGVTNITTFTLTLGQVASGSANALPPPAVFSMPDLVYVNSFTVRGGTTSMYKDIMTDSSKSPSVGTLSITPVYPVIIYFDRPLCQRTCHVTSSVCFCFVCM
jgi:hypothetical protein